MDALLEHHALHRVESEAGSEARLVERAVHGDRSAFGQLYLGYADTVYRYVLFQVGEVTLAEDLTQEIFISAFRGIRRLKQPDRFRSWLLRIAHNCVQSHWRSRAREPVVTELPAPDRPPAARHEAALEVRPLDQLELRLAADEVLVAAGALTVLQQQVLALRLVADLSVAETAAIMGRSENAVKNLLHHALISLRREIEHAGRMP